MSDHEHDDDSRADLSALDLTRDPVRFDRLAGRITAGAALPLEARRRQARRRPAHRAAAPSPLATIAAWRLPVLAAAALVAAVALGSLQRAPAAAPMRVASRAPSPLVLAAVGVPRPLARMVASESPSRAADVVALLGGYAR